MNLSDAGAKLIASFEGLRLEAYQDSVGVWTIGYGHTGHVHPGDTITQTVALGLLDQDAATAASAINKLVRVALNQNQFDALVSFTYNVGVGNFASSTLLKRLNACDYAGAADQFLVWDKAGGKALPGLANRRAAERAYFLQAV